MGFIKYGDPAPISKIKYFQCVCYNNQHILKVEKEEDQIICSIFLNNYLGFFSRLLYALKYVLGYKCKNGHFDSFIFKQKDIVELKKFLDESIKLNNISY